MAYVVAPFLAHHGYRHVGRQTGRKRYRSFIFTTFCNVDNVNAVPAPASASSPEKQTPIMHALWQ